MIREVSHVWGKSEATEAIQGREGRGDALCCVRMLESRARTGLSVVDII